MKRRDFLKHSAVGAAALLGPAACAVPGQQPDAEPTGRPDELVLWDEGLLVVQHAQVRLEVNRAEHTVTVRRFLHEVTVGGQGGDGSSLNSPSMALLEPGDTGRFHVVDRGNGRIQVYTLDGAHVATHLQGELHMPAGAAFADDGTLWVADTFNHRVLGMDARGRVVATLDDAEAVGTPVGITVDRSGALHVLDASNRRVNVLSTRGAVQHSYGAFRTATSITTGPDGAVYVGDAHGARVHAFHPAGHLLAEHRPVHGGRRLTPMALAFGAAGDLHISGLPGAPA